MNGAERILDRAIAFARAGQPHPWTCLIQAHEVEQGDVPADYLRVFWAVRNEAGGPLTRWYEGQRRKAAETVALLEEALFKLQLGA